VSDTVTLADVRAGYDRIESGRTVGKTVVDVGASRDVKSADSRLTRA
jgi:hypothetical protein